MSPDPGILGRLSVDSSGGSRKPAHEQRTNDKRIRESFAENTVASLMRMIRCRRYLGCSLSVRDTLHWRPDFIDRICRSQLGLHACESGIAHYPARGFGAGNRV